MKEVSTYNSFQKTLNPKEYLNKISSYAHMFDGLGINEIYEYIENNPEMREQVKCHIQPALMSKISSLGSDGLLPNNILETIYKIIVKLNSENLLIKEYNIDSIYCIIRREKQINYNELFTVIILLFKFNFFGLLATFPFLNNKLNKQLYLKCIENNNTNIIIFLFNYANKSEMLAEIGIENKQVNILNEKFEIHIKAHNEDADILPAILLFFKELMFLIGPLLLSFAYKENGGNINDYVHYYMNILKKSYDNYGSERFVIGRLYNELNIESTEEKYFEYGLHSGFFKYLFENCLATITEKSYSYIEGLLMFLSLVLDKFSEKLHKQFAALIFPYIKNIIKFVRSKPHKIAEDSESSYNTKKITEYKDEIKNLLAGCYESLLNKKFSYVYAKSLTYILNYMLRSKAIFINTDYLICILGLDYIKNIKINNINNINITYLLTSLSNKPSYETTYRVSNFIIKYYNAEIFDSSGFFDEKYRKTVNKRTEPFEWSIHVLSHNDYIKNERGLFILSFIINKTIKFIMCENITNSFDYFLEQIIKIFNSINVNVLVFTNELFLEEYNTTLECIESYEIFKSIK